MEPLHAIIPAAGRSQRMGRPKLLLDYAGTTLLGSLIGTLQDAGVDSLRVVIRPGDQQLQDWLRDHDIRTVINPTPEDGMLSSILAGIHDMTPETGNLLISPADLPTFEAETIRQLRIVFEEKSADLAVPTIEGQRGHPLLISHRLRDEVCALDPKTGLNQILDRGYTLEKLAVQDAGVLRDIDTPADYRALRSDP